MYPNPDPFMPSTARFPLSPAQGRMIPSPEGPSMGDNRPFGMRFGVKPIQAEKHGKKPTQKSKSKPTAITDDGQITGYKPDIEYYTEMDEE